MVSVAEVIARMGGGKASTYAYTPEQTVEEVVEKCIYSAQLYIMSILEKINKEFDESDKLIKEAILLFSIGEIYDFSNSEETGEEVKTQAKNLLYNSFKKEDTTQDTLVPYMKVTRRK